MVSLDVLVIVVEDEEYWTVQSQLRKQIVDSFFEHRLFHDFAFPKIIILGLN